MDLSGLIESATDGVIKGNEWLVIAAVVLFILTLPTPKGWSAMTKDDELVEKMNQEELAKIRDRDRACSDPTPVALQRRALLNALDRGEKIDPEVLEKIRRDDQWVLEAMPNRVAWTEWDRHVLLVALDRQRKAEEQVTAKKEEQVTAKKDLTEKIEKLRAIEVQRDALVEVLESDLAPVITAYFDAVRRIHGLRPLARHGYTLGHSTTGQVVSDLGIHVHAYFGGEAVDDEIPFEFLTDPEGWESRTREKNAQEARIASIAQKQKEEQREREQLAKLAAKYGLPGTDEVEARKGGEL